jgi:hypothetical protein
MAHAIAAAALKQEWRHAKLTSPAKTKRPQALTRGRLLLYAP